MKHLAMLYAATLLVGCATPISKSLTTDIAATVPNDRGASAIIQGLQDSAFNFDEAVRVGALDATDPAPGCVHGVLKDLGVEASAGTAPPAVFTPRVSDLLSAGSVLYIRVKQAERLAGTSVVVPTDCKALVGQLIIDVARQGLSVLPGAGLLPKLR